MTVREEVISTSGAQGRRAHCLRRHDGISSSVSLSCNATDFVFRHPSGSPCEDMVNQLTPADTLSGCYLLSLTQELNVFWQHPCKWQMNTLAWKQTMTPFTVLDSWQLLCSKLWVGWRSASQTISFQDLGRRNSPELDMFMPESRSSRGQVLTHNRTSSFCLMWFYHIFNGQSKSHGQPRWG